MAVNQQPEKILVVDDDKNFVMALMTFLAGHGYQPLFSYDTTNALRNATHEDVSLIILDLNLPGGGGLFFIENLRLISKTMCVPVIVSSANVAPGIEKKVREMGASDYIQKPYDLEQLLKKIKGLLPNSRLTN